MGSAQSPGKGQTLIPFLMYMGTSWLTVTQSNWAWRKAEVGATPGPQQQAGCHDHPQQVQPGDSLASQFCRRPLCGLRVSEGRRLAGREARKQLPRPRSLGAVSPESPALAPPLARRLVSPRRRWRSTSLASARTGSRVPTQTSDPQGRLSLQLQVQSALPRRRRAPSPPP